MNSTFIEALAHCNKEKDLNSKNFLEYILSKYFCEERLFMSMKDAIPYLDKGDLEVFIPIVYSIE
jgi:hypothetical protein